jgi:hypothetical protein
MEFKSAKEMTIVSVPLIKVFVLGGYGTGKSVFASTFPTPGFVLDFDDGMLSYRGRDWDYETFEMSGKGWVKFESVYRHIKKAAESGKYRTIVLDSATSMTDVAMERALQIDPKRSAEGGPIWNVHYMIVRNLMAPRLNNLLTFPCNIVVCGHWKVETDQKTGAIISVDPLLTGQLSAKVPGYFDEIYTAFTKMRDGKERYILRTVTRGFYKARSRISGPFRLLPDEIPNNYPALLKHMEAGARKEEEIRDEREEVLRKKLEEESEETTDTEGEEQ